MNRGEAKAHPLISAAETTLVLIDFQPKLMLGCQTIAPQVLRSNATALAKIGAIFELPIITTGGTPDDPFLPDVAAAAGRTRVQVDRRTIDAWQTAAFVRAIEQSKRSRLVIAGITTDLCVLLPALSARAAGYDVQVVVDASGCFTPQIENAALNRLGQQGVQLTTWAAFAAELHRSSNWYEGVGPQVMQVFAAHHGGIGLIASMRA